MGFSQGKSDRFLDINVGEEDIFLDARTRNAQILHAIGLDASSHDMEIWIPPVETERITHWLYAQGWREGDPLIALHPGCHWGCNEWLMARWVELGNEVQKRFACKIVITG